MFSKHVFDTGKRWVVLAALLACPLAAFAQGQVARNIHVDLSHVDPGLPCPTVAARTHVRFDASALSFRPKRLEVVLNGAAVASKDVRYAWPEVTLDHGLQAGRNTVELVAVKPDGKKVKRKIVIKVGNSVHSTDGIQLACTGMENEPAAVESHPIVRETPRAVTYAVPPAVVYGPVPSFGWYGSPWLAGGYYGWQPGLSVGFGYSWRPRWHHHHHWRHRWHPRGHGRWHRHHRGHWHRH